MCVWLLFCYSQCGVSLRGTRTVFLAYQDSIIDQALGRCRGAHDRPLALGATIARASSSSWRARRASLARSRSRAPVGCVRHEPSFATSTAANSGGCGGWPATDGFRPFSLHGVLRKHLRALLGTLAWTTETPLTQTGKAAVGVARDRMRRGEADSSGH